MKAVALLFAYSALMCGATITVSANCSGLTIVISPTDETCKGNGSSSATGSFVETSNSITIDGTAISGGGSNIHPGSPFASAGIEVRDTIQGDGTSRIGYLEISKGSSQALNGPTGSGGFDIFLNGQPVNFCALSGCGPIPLIQIQLGAPITIEIGVFSEATDDDGGGVTVADGFRVSLLEADGITPVNAFATVPEPTSLAVMAIGLCLLAVARRNSDGMQGSHVRSPR